MIAAEGGEIIPDLSAPPPKPVPTFAELQPKPAPAGAVPTAPPVEQPKPVVMEGVRPVMSGAGPRPPGMAEAPQPTAGEVALIQQIDREINFELNVLNMCYGATHNFVVRWQASQPPDAAEFAQFDAGKRTPLDLAEPQMALEVYRQVRESLRHAERGKTAVEAPKEPLSIIGQGLNAALIALSREKP